VPVCFVKLQVLSLFLAVVVVGALGADVVLKGRAEARLTAEVIARSPETSGVRSRIRSFPFVGRLLTSGTVSAVDITAQHANPGGVALTDLRVHLEDVELDRDAAIDGRAVVRSITRGRVQADLGQDQINTRLPKQFRIDLQPGTAKIEGPGKADGTLTLNPEGMIQLRIGNRTVFELTLPETGLLPCRPAGTFIAGAIRLTCDFTEIPPLLADLAGG